MPGKLRTTALATAAVAAALTLSACSSDAAAAAGTTVITLGVVGEWNDHWYTVNELLEPEGIEIELVRFNDFATPNRALNDGDIDANAFQHQLFLGNDIATQGYEIEAIAETFWGPLNIFPNRDRVQSLDDLTDGASIGIPSDPTNGARALELLQAAGLLTLGHAEGTLASVLDITENPRNLDIVEAESGLLFSMLPDLDAAAINAGNAITAGLRPTEDGIFGESDEWVNVEPLINVVAVRSDDLEDPERAAIFERIVAALHTDETRTTLLDAFGGAYIPVW